MLLTYMPGGDSLFFFWGPPWGSQILRYPLAKNSFQFLQLSNTVELFIVCANASLAMRLVKYQLYLWKNAFWIALELK
jgi:hypothetical protein